MDFGVQMPRHLVTINPRRRVFMAPVFVFALICAVPGVILATLGLGLVFIASEALAWLEGPRK